MFYLLHAISLLLRALLVAHPVHGLDTLVCAETAEEKEYYVGEEVVELNRCKVCIVYCVTYTLAHHFCYYREVNLLTEIALLDAKVEECLR